MSYIGNTPTQQAFTPAIDYFSGNGSTVAFTLSRPVASVAQVQAVIENVAQNPSSAFTVSGNTITFTSAPPSGSNNIYVYYTSPITQVIQPGQGTVQPSSLSQGGPYWDTSSNLGIGTSSPNQKLQVHNPIASSSLVQMTNASTGSAGGDGCYFGIDASGNTYAWNQENGPILFGTNNGERMRIDSSGQMWTQNGAGSVAKAYDCRAWVNFNGTGTVAIRASGNVSSITDNGVGDYTVNFTTAMPDINYATNATGSNWSDTTQAYISTEGKNSSSLAAGKLTTSIRIGTGSASASVDAISVNVSIFR